MKVFVTGATGFVGGRLVPRLVREGHEVTCLVRPSSHTDSLEALGVCLAVGDVTQRTSLQSALPGHDWLVNLANIYSLWEPDPSVYEQVNVEGTRNVMEAALEAEVGKVIHVSTYAVWGRQDKMPFTEETPMAPERSTRYADTKYRGDVLAWQLHVTRGLPLVVVYPAAILGAGDTKVTSTVISSLLEEDLPALVCADSPVTFVHIDDVVEAIIQAADKAGNVGEKYLVGKETMTVSEIFGMVCQCGGVAPPRMKLPDSLARVTARVLTTLADWTKRPPKWGLSSDYLSSIQPGVWCDGSKAERELGIVYTPLRAAVEEEVAAIGAGRGPRVADKAP